MNRIKYENYLGAAGYDAVARRKIKELEKKLGPQMVEKVLYQTDNAEYSDMGGMYAHALSITGSITAGKTYKVELDGTSYECVGKPDKGFGDYMGNESLINPMANDTGEEFIMAHENPNDMSTGYMILCTKQFANIKISTMEEKSSGGGGAAVIFDLIPVEGEGADSEFNGICSHKFEEVCNLLKDCICPVVVRIQRYPDIPEETYTTTNVTYGIRHMDGASGIIIAFSWKEPYNNSYISRDMGTIEYMSNGVEEAIFTRGVLD